MKIGKIDLLLYILFFAFLLHQIPALLKNSSDTGLNGSFKSSERDIVSKNNSPAFRSPSSSSGASQQGNVPNLNSSFPFREMIPPSEKKIIASAAMMAQFQMPTTDVSPSWDEFVARHSISKEEALTPVENDWRFMENFCLFESNKSIYLINNTKLYPTKKYPKTFYSWYYKRYLYFRNNSLTSFPPGMRVLDSVYLFMTRGWGGWNNIYHHTEWVNNLLRYVHKAASLPRMETVAFYPDPINQNQTFGDPKGHFRWGLEYYKLAKTVFPASSMPHFLEGSDYSALNASFCARRGIIARIVPTMYDSFVSTAEPMLVRLLAYHQFRLALRTQPPSRLSVFFLNRNGGSRGIRNVEEIIEYMQKANETELNISSNSPATFEDQVRSVAHIDVYVSMHGAAMTNILFMEPLSALIEMNPPKFKEAFYRNMASKANLLFYGIYSTYTENMEYSMREQSTAKILNQWITVPLRLFGKTFDLATKNVWKYKYRMCDY